MNVRRAGLAFCLFTSLAACSGSSGSVSTAAAPVAPKPFEYAGGTSTYRFVQTGTTTQSMMGQSREIPATATRVLTVTMARTSPDTVGMSVLVDSLTMSGMPGMPAPNTAQFVGKTFASKLAPNGTVYTVTPPAGASQEVEAMAEELGRMMPRLRAVLTMGAQWTDTLEDSPRQGPLTLKRRQITVYRVAADTMVGSEAAWKIARTTATTMSGTGTQQGQQLNLDGTGTATGSLLMSKRGVLLGAELEDKSEAKVLVPASGFEVGLVINASTKVTKVK